MDIKTEYESTNLDLCVKEEEVYEKLEWLDDATGLSSPSKKIAKKRKKYQKIDNDIRLKIIEEVQKNGKLLKNAAEKFNVNYSSAKSIFHVYRKEGRILKKPCKGKPSKANGLLTNPATVFVEIPAQSMPAPPLNANEMNQGFFSQALYKAPLARSLSVNFQMVQGNSSADTISLLHPSSALMIQSFCNSNTSISFKPTMAAYNENAAETYQPNTNLLMQTSRNSIPKFEYAPIPQTYYLTQQNIQESSHLKNNLLLGSNSASESLKNAYLINQWIKQQWRNSNLDLYEKDPVQQQ